MDQTSAERSIPIPDAAASPQPQQAGAGAATVAAGSAQPDWAVRLEAAMDRLSNGFDHKIAFDAGRDQQIKMLHGELQQYKAGLLQTMLTPVATQLVRVRDDAGRRTESLRRRPAAELDGARLFKELGGFQDDLLMVLEGIGVQPYEEPSSAFAAARQQAVGTVPTGHADRHGSVVERVLPGYEMGGRVLVKERVRIYVFDQALAAAAAVTPTEQPGAAPAAAPNAGPADAPADVATAAAPAPEPEVVTSAGTD